MKVEIQSKKWIKPATPTPPHLQKHQLSAIDELISPKFLQLIFHYNIGNETEKVTTTPERLTRLEESLSNILSLYYPFAGRYNNEDESVVIYCLDQGVDFAVASVDCKLDQLIEGGEHDQKVLLYSLDRLRSSSNDTWTPVMLVQVNVFYLQEGVLSAIFPCPFMLWRAAGKVSILCHTLLELSGGCRCQVKHCLGNTVEQRLSGVDSINLQKAFGSPLPGQAFVCRSGRVKICR